MNKVNNNVVRKSKAQFHNISIYSKLCLVDCGVNSDAVLSTAALQQRFPGLESQVSEPNGLQRSTAKMDTAGETLPRTKHRNAASFSFTNIKILSMLINKTMQTAVGSP